MIHLHNTGTFGGTLPESYYDLQSLVANPPPPGFLSLPGSKEDFKYISSPTSLGQLPGVYLNDIKSMKLIAKVDTTQPTPLTIEVEFDCSGPQEVVSENIGGVGSMNFKNFSVRISLTLTFDKDNAMIDVLSWVPDLDWTRWTFEPQLNGQNLSFKVSGQFLGQPKTGLIPISSGTGTTMNSGLFMGSDFVKGLIGQVIDVELDLWDSSIIDFKGRVRDQIFSKLVAARRGH